MTTIRLFEYPSPDADLVLLADRFQLQAVEQSGTGYNGCDCGECNRGTGCDPDYEAPQVLSCPCGCGWDVREAIAEYWRASNGTQPGQ